MVSYTYNAIIWQVEAGGLGIQSQPWLYSEFKDSLGYVIPPMSRKERRRGGSDEKMRKEEMKTRLKYLS